MPLIEEAARDGFATNREWAVAELGSLSHVNRAAQAVLLEVRLHVALACSAVVRHSRQPAWAHLHRRIMLAHKRLPRPPSHSVPARCAPPSPMRQVMPKGIAFHHADLSSEQRSLVERAFAISACAVGRQRLGSACFGPVLLLAGARHEPLPDEGMTHPSWTTRRRRVCAGGNLDAGGWRQPARAPCRLPPRLHRHQQQPAGRNEVPADGAAVGRPSRWHPTGRQSPPSGACVSGPSVHEPSSQCCRCFALNILGARARCAPPTMQAGRAGRAGIDTRGEAILLGNETHNLALIKARRAVPRFAARRTACLFVQSFRLVLGAPALNLRLWPCSPASPGPGTRPLLRTRTGAAAPDRELPGRAGRGPPRPPGHAAHHPGGRRGRRRQHLGRCRPLHQARGAACPAPFDGSLASARGVSASLSTRLISVQRSPT
jgi:hypothetical protein